MADRMTEWIAMECQGGEGDDDDNPSQCSHRIILLGLRWRLSEAGCCRGSLPVTIRLDCSYACTDTANRRLRLFCRWRLDDSQSAESRSRHRLLRHLCAASSEPVRSIVWPGDCPHTQPYGCRDVLVEPWDASRGCHFHCGVDIAMPVGTPLYAARAGTISFVW